MVSVSVNMGGRETENMTMTTYKANQVVDPGLYFSVRPLGLKSIERTGPLPGNEPDVYRRVPMLLMLAMAPLLGLAFVIFLPFIGFAMVFRLAGEKAVEVGARAATEGVRVMRPAWAPALAFLSRSRPAPKTPAATTPAPDAWAEEVKEQLDATEHPER
jgi:hypothetical protein